MNTQHKKSLDPKKKLTKVAKRRKARSLVMQALYSWHIAKQSLSAIEANFKVNNNFEDVDSDYFHEVLHKVPHYLPEIDNKFMKKATRDNTEIDPVELAVLRLATYELIYRLDIPYKVVINEAVELAKIFGATDGHKFVNGILDKIVPEIRSSEVF